MVFRCTAKMQKRIGLRPADLGPIPDAVVATEWHCLPVIEARRPLVMVTHSLSLFTVIIPAAGITTPERLAGAVREVVRGALEAEGFEPGAVGKVVDEGADLFCKTSDRRVLGSMNEIGLQLNGSIVRHGGVDPISLADADHQINDMPMTVLDWESPRRFLTALLRPRGQA